MDETKARLHSLDALRGVAALAVVCWHWQHLQLLGTPKLTWPPPSGAGDPAHEPFHPALWLFYQQGFRAVDLFFLLSGFIFFWLYRDKLASRFLSVTDFAFLRFSRLYPLHIITFLLAVSLQMIFIRLMGQPFIYPDNDMMHFMAQLFLINGAVLGDSFNGPTWSLSVEVLMYGLFCLFARMGWLRSPVLPVWLFVSGLTVLFFTPHSGLGRGIAGFFLGGLTYQGFVLIKSSPRRRLFLLGIAAIVSAGWLAVFLDAYKVDAFIRFVRLTPFVDPRALSYAAVYGLFPLTILAAALHETLSGARYASLAWLGEISYSSYLLHIPLQLVFAVTVAVGLLQADAVRSTPAMVIYFAILIPLSIMVFRNFEVPVQKALRRRWTGSDIVVGGPAPAEI
jgi:peptidoglycan/LPS O-acetylase OafA/YrhL